MDTTPAVHPERVARLHPAGLLLAPLLSLLALLVLATPASADGGILDAVTDLVEEATDELADAPLVDELIEPVAEVLPEVAVQASVELETPLELVPTVAADVDAGTDILTTDVELTVTVDDVADLGADVTVDVPAPDLEAGIDVAIDVEGPAVNEAPTPEVPDAVVRDPPAASAAPLDPVESSIGSEPTGSPRWSPPANLVRPHRSATERTPGWFSSPPLTDDQTAAHPAHAIARVIDTIAAALAQTTSGVASAAGVGVAVVGMLSILALIPPTLIGRLIPASPAWRSKFLALPPDPPG